MRRTLGVFLFAAGITGHGLEAAAQFTEETIEVPTSRETIGQSSDAGAGEPDEDGWQSAASEYDIERIAANEAHYAEALAVAHKSGSEADIADLMTVLTALPQPIDAAALPGRWQCRTIRVTSEPARLAVYGWWDCQITDLSAGLLLEKLTGSELSSGYLYPETDTRMVYLGHRHGRNEPARPYDGADGPEGDDPENRDDPAILTSRGADRLILVKPKPTLAGSDYDFLELRRQ